MGLQHLELVGGDAGVGLDDGLAALDRHDHGAEVADGLDLAGEGGVAVEGEVGRDAVAKNPIQGGGAGAVGFLGGEVDAQVGEGVLEGVDRSGGDAAVGADDLEHAEPAEGLVAAQVLRIGDALGVDGAEDAEAGVEQLGAGGGIAGGVEQGDVLGTDAVGAAGVEHGDGLGEEGGAFQRGEGGVGREGIEQLVQVGLEAAEGLGVDAVDGRDAFAQAFLGGEGFFRALVGKRDGGGDAHGGDLVGQDGQGAVGHADERNQHDGGYGGDEEGDRDDAGGVEAGGEAEAGGRGGLAAAQRGGRDRCRGRKRGAQAGEEIGEGGHGRWRRARG